MKKTVLKRSEILESVRPIIIKHLEPRDIDDSFTPFSSFGAMPSILNENPIDMISNGNVSSTLEDNTMSSDSLISDNVIESIDTDVVGAFPGVTSESDFHIEEEPLSSNNSFSDFSYEQPPSYQNNETEEDYKKLLNQIETAKFELSSIQNSIRNNQAEAQDIINNANQEKSRILNSAKETGKQEGVSEGLLQGQEESKRLIQLLQKISSKIIDEKNTILTNIEADLVDLSLLIAGKVVKSITESYKRVVYDNVVAAIAKLKVKSDLIIKVNPEDLPTVEKYKSNIISEIQGLENLQFIEDPTVDKGGCIIISDFGSVDARISSQLAEIEEQVRKISPIKDL